MASVEDTTEVVCSRGVRLVADTLISQLPSASNSHYDAIALPVWPEAGVTCMLHVLPCERCPHMIFRRDRVAFCSRTLSTFCRAACLALSD